MTPEKHRQKKISNQNKNSFELSLKRLEEIVDNLEKGTLPLDQAIKLYEEGIQLSKQCIEILNNAELKLKTLSKDIEENFIVENGTLEES